MKPLAISFLLVPLVMAATYAAPALASTGADSDGDDVDDAVDNCRLVFNPSQADYDADGIGDACKFVPVDDLYYIGSTEVTNQEYKNFLNAVAAADPNGLFNTLMQSDPRGGINRSGASGSYTYSTKANMGNKPVSYVSWLDAARYVNWLVRGRPRGAQAFLTTETGAYNLTLANPGVTATRGAGAVWFLPSEAEWVHSAHHDQGLGVDWLYPTRSNDEPARATANGVGDISNPGPNVVNYDGVAGRHTTVGSAGSESASYYGTFDQGGNVAEWTETLSSGNRVTRGGSFADGVNPLRSDTHVVKAPFTEEATTGFRVARSFSCPDSDADGEADCVDNCPTVANPAQEDSDLDRIGDACDACPGGPLDDMDADGFCDELDNCPTVSNPDQADCNGDGRGDACAVCPCDPGPPDPDGDGICSSHDNCPTIYNPDQQDTDGDGSGDACDDCSFESTPGQADQDNDGVGNVCDLDDGLILILFDDKDQIHWQQESGFEAWNVYEGDLDVLKATGIYTQAPGSNASADRRCDVTSTRVNDFDSPAVGKTTFSLVEGIHNGTEGSLGQDGAGTERPNANPCP